MDDTRFNETQETAITNPHLSLEMLKRPFLFLGVFEHLSEMEILTFSYCGKPARKLAGIALRRKLISEGIQFSMNECPFEVLRAVRSSRYFYLDMDKEGIQDHLQMDIRKIDLREKQIETKMIIDRFVVGIKFVAFIGKLNGNLQISKKSDFERDSSLLQYNYLLEKKEVKSFNFKPRNPILLYGDSTTNSSLKQDSPLSLISNSEVGMDSKKGDKLTILVYNKQKKVNELEELFIDDEVSRFSSSYMQLCYQKHSGEFFFVQNFGMITSEHLEAMEELGLAKNPLKIQIVGLEAFEIKKITCTSKRVFFMTRKNGLYSALIRLGNKQIKQKGSIIRQIYNEKLPNQVYQVFVEKMYPELTRRDLQGFFTGLYQEFLVIQGRNKPVSLWDSEDTREWFKSLGIFSVDQIIKYKGITGVEILNMDASYLKSTFNIKKTEEVHKILTEWKIQKQSILKSPKVLAKGINTNGQIASINKGTTVHSLSEIEIPKLGLNEQIKDIQSGFKSTMLITSTNRVFITKQEAPMMKRNRKLSVYSNASNTEEEMIIPESAGLRRRKDRKRGKGGAQYQASKNFKFQGKKKKNRRKMTLDDELLLLNYNSNENQNPNTNNSKNFTSTSRWIEITNINHSIKMVEGSKQKKSNNLKVHPQNQSHQGNEHSNISTISSVASNGSSLIAKHPKKKKKGKKRGRKQSTTYSLRLEMEQEVEENTCLDTITNIGISKNTVFFMTGYSGLGTELSQPSLLKHGSSRQKEKIQGLIDPYCVLNKLQTTPHFKVKEWLVQFKNNWMTLQEALSSKKLTQCRKFQHRKKKTIVWEAYTGILDLELVTALQSNLLFGQKIFRIESQIQE